MCVEPVAVVRCSVCITWSTGVQGPKWKEERPLSPSFTVTHLQKFCFVFLPLESVGKKFWFPGRGEFFH